jgi:hypothetical protein
MRDPDTLESEIRAEMAAEIDEGAEIIRGEAVDADG